MSSGNTIKRIFISDIHIGDGRSVSPGRNFHPYCWFYDDRPDMLVEFLKQYCIDDESVAEVVIVGDLFDEWVCPTQFDPTDRDHQEQQFKNVANASQNQLVTAWLRELARQQRLIYLRGNHDMLANKPIMEEISRDLSTRGVMMATMTTATMSIVLTTAYGLSTATGMVFSMRPCPPDLVWDDSGRVCCPSDFSFPVLQPRTA